MLPTPVCPEEDADKAQGSASPAISTRVARSSTTYGAGPLVRMNVTVKRTETGYIN